LHYQCPHKLVFQSLCNQHLHNPMITLPAHTKAHTIQCVCNINICANEFLHKRMPVPTNAHEIKPTTQCPPNQHVLKQIPRRPAVVYDWELLEMLYPLPGLAPRACCRMHASWSCATPLNPLATLLTSASPCPSLLSRLPTVSPFAPSVINLTLGAVPAVPFLALLSQLFVCCLF
jgi:hypothetical protein